MTKWALILALAATESSPLPTDLFIDLPTQAQAGALVLGRVPTGSEVRLAARPVPVAADGRVAFGLPYDARDPVEISVRLPNAITIAHRLSVRPRVYPVQRVDGLPQHTVTPDAKLQARIDAENAQVGRLRADSSGEPAFDGLFIDPVANARTTGVYGAQRILNGVPRQPHFGLDRAAPTGTAIRAMAAGRVELAAPDFVLTGGTVMIDHGLGVHSTYLHLSRIDVAVGDEVAAGDLIGAVGMTGRATGPHLCLRLNWYEVRLDPALALGLDQKTR